MNGLRRGAAFAAALIFLSSQTTIRKRPVVAAAGLARPERIPIPEPPRRTPHPLPPTASFHALISNDVHQPSGKRLSGPPMLRPIDVGRILAAGRTQVKQRSAHGAAGSPPPVVPRAASPGRTHGLPAPGKAQTRTTQSIQAPSGTGINHWWRYQEENVPGGGHVMVNVGTGNVLLQDDDMVVPHKGVSLTFRRTYNSQSLHTVAGAGAEDNGNNSTGPGMYGNGWTNTFDAHMVKLSPTIRSVYDIDGARYDFAMPANPSWTSAMILTPATPGNHDYVQYDGSCGWFWIKKSGTIYYFYLTDPGTGCPVLGTLGAYSGRLYQIVGRNHNTNLTLTYSWDQGDASAASGKVSKIVVQAESGMTATLNFADVAGHRLLGGLVFPDGTTNVTYGYDTLGNLNNVSRPPNNAAGDRPSHSYGYVQQGSGGSIIGWADSPRWAKGTGDGDVTSFAFTGSSPQTATLNQMSRFANVNPIIPDGSNPGVTGGAVQSGYPTSAYEYYDEYYATGGSTATYRDTDGHGTNWVLDAQGRPTQTQECVVVVNQTCDTNAYLTAVYSWDADNNLLSEVDPRGAETDYAYDVDGNTVAVAGPAPVPGASRPTSLYLYGAYDNLVAYCDPIATHALQAEWTSRPVPPIPVGSGSCPAQSTLATRYQWTYPWYQPFGQLTASISPGTPAAPNGYQRTYAYDAGPQGGGDYGLPTSVTGAAISQNDAVTPSRQPQQSFWYDANGNLVCYGTGNGQWLLSYDALGRLTSASDPDDASGGAGVCGKTGAQAGWNTTSRTAYFPDGTVAAQQTPSQVANGISTSFTYDVDGNEKTETHHHGCTSTTNCPGGITQKFYDGADRLVEVMQPWDKWDVQTYPWSTRYIYDLSGGRSVPYRGMSLAGHGNLAKTQELISGSVWTPGVSTYPESTGSWTDVRATAYDALDRVTAQYEASFSDTPKIANTYDGPNAAGLLSTTRRATGELRTNSYDAIGRLTDVAYSGDGGITPGVHSVYDAAGHITSQSTDVLGAQAMQYDQAGNLLSISEPASLGSGTIGYHYYGDGKRKDVTYQSTANPLATIAQYTYRNDGKRQTLQLPNGSRFTWTYTAAGREQAQSDPLTGTTITPTATYQVGKAVPQKFYPASMTYGARTATYDAFGRLNGLTLPEALFSYTYSSSQVDLDDSPLEETRHVYEQDYNGQPTPVLQPICALSNVRNEKIVNLSQSSCSNFLSGPTDLNGLMLTPAKGQAKVGWTVDSRAGVRLANVSTDTYGLQVGTQYSYDPSGRLTTEFNGNDIPCTGDYFSSTGPNRCYTYGTRSKSYDAENRLHADAYPFVGVDRTPTSYGYAFGSFWYDETRAYEPPNVAGVDYDGASHPAQISLYHPIQGRTETVRWLWDGNDRFLQCTIVNGQCNALTYSLEGLADYDPQTNAVTAVYDRNLKGAVATYHMKTRFGSWTDSYGGPNVLPAHRNDICSDGTTSDPTTCDVLRTGKLTSDGWTIDNDTWQGVRTSDLSIGLWNTPDAYAGDVHDPMSQKPFMWNRNNPYQYTDPSGLEYVTAPLFRSDDIFTVAGSAVPGINHELHIYSVNESRWGLSGIGGPRTRIGSGGYQDNEAQAIADQLNYQNSPTYRAKLAAAEAEARYPAKAGRYENHHIEPKYLGGSPSGPTVRIPAAYHQAITNEFRMLAPYGAPKLPPGELGRIMEQVYGKYPI